MKQVPQISQAEYEVRKIIWKYAPIATSQVVERLSDSKWSPKTIQTMLLRLVKKGALANEKQGRSFVYTPLVGAEEYRLQASHRFLDRLYDGALGSMVLNFIEQDQLSEEEIQSLKALLDGMDKGEKDD